MKKILFAVCCLTVFGSLMAFKFAPVTEVAAPQAEVNWYTWEDAVAANAVHKKKIYIDIYTDWCGPCKYMDKTTFSDPQVVNYLNENFYPVKFNAERKEPLTHNGTTHVYTPFQNRGYHQFAASLLEGKLSYPTSVFLTEDLVLEQRISGTLSPVKMHKVLTYVAEETVKHSPMSWNEYQKQYDIKYVQSNRQN